MANIATSVTKICDSIKNLLKSKRTPQVVVPSILLACSAINRPGLSIMSIVSNIISTQPEAGVGYGPMADGSANGYEAMVRIMTEEIVNAIKYDSQVQVTSPIGSIMSVGIAQPGGGIVNCVNVNNWSGNGVTK